MRKSRNNPYIVLIAIVFTAIVIIGMVMFITNVNNSDFWLFKVFDNVFNYEEKEKLNVKSTTEANVYLRAGGQSELLEDSAQKCIFDYFTLYYASLGGFSEEKLSQVFTADSEDILFAEAELSYIIRLREKSPVALTFSLCDVGLYLSSVVPVGNDLYEIKLTENNSIRYDFVGDDGKISTQSGIEHFFLLKLQGDKWLISEHSSVSDVSTMLSDLFDEKIAAAGHKRSELTLSYLPEYIGAATEQLLSEISETGTLSDEEATEKEAEYDYNRTIAVDYANQWVSPERMTRNYDKYASYEKNSMNFVSQCLFAGTIPMDDQGESSEQWKWYGDEPNDLREKAGYSSSWINGESFTEYCETNDGFGLVSSVGYDYKKGEIGDVIQFLSGSSVQFEAIIVDVITDENGNFSDYLIAANSDELLNFPASAVGYPQKRLVKIFGYNTY